MMAYWKKFDAWLMALTLRERVLGMLCAVLVLGYLGYQLQLAPMYRQNASLRDTIQQQRQQMAAIDSELAQLAAAAKRDPDQELRRQLASVQADSTALREKLRAAQKGLVAPERMGPLLQQMVNGHGKLRLLSLKTLAPQGTTDGQFLAPEAGEAREAQSKTAPLLYRHGVQVVLQGSYLDMITYLEALEAMPQQLFWGNAALDASGDGAARLSLTLYTLSLDSKWIAL
ncbi:type II secretion system protein GspM [Duganella fentianensis]|uniref:type II secretion system protein GspM n=1 Tax=Duganella fentianensis TaxID=2692177 RepID=UPI0032B13224